jgi:hypothetical protein
MGASTDFHVRQWQESVGIEPATGRGSAILERIARRAADLIQVVALEKSGIRDGDGWWHGSDALVGTVDELVQLRADYERRNDEAFWAAREAEADDFPF